MAPKPDWWGKVDTNGPSPAHAPDLGPCWLWTGARTKDGYGQVKRGGRNQRAHRVAYSEAVGPVAAEAIIGHRCDTKLCVRPAHLFAGSQADNIADMVAKRRSRSWGKAQRLTAADVPGIRDAAARGESRISIARRFGVSAGAIDGVVSGRSWAA